MTTTNLKLSARHWWRLHERTIANMAWGASMAVALMLIHSLLRPQPAATFANAKVEQAKPAILVMTATAAPPLPTATPWPTPEPQVIIQQAEPQVIYVQQPAETAPTPPPMIDPPPTLEPQQSVLLDRQQWAEDAAQHNGGSGKMPAPDVGPIPSGSTQDSNYLWCAGAAAAGGGARCVGR